MGITSLGPHAVEKGDVGRGDHIYVYHLAGAYSHHGIVADDRCQRVYHFRDDIDKCAAKRCSSNGGKSCCFNVGRRRGQSGAAVVSSCIACFARRHGPFKFGGDHTLHRHEYSASQEEVEDYRKGSCSTAPRDSPDDALRRAEECFRNGFGTYNLATNNCENFALYCCTGECLPSAQVTAAGNALGILRGFQALELPLITKVWRTQLQASSFSAGAASMFLARNALAPSLGVWRRV